MHTTRTGWWRCLRGALVMAIVALAVGPGQVAIAQNPEDGEIDYGTLEGIERAVARVYSGDTTALATPETTPSTTFQISAFVTEFGTTDHAAAAWDPLLAAVQAGYAEDPSITMERIDPGDLGDQAVADVATTEQDGLTFELAAAHVQADAFFYEVVVIGFGTETGSLETATAVVQAMIEAEAGSGDELFDESGASTGGLWDKLPVEGDAVINGLIPDKDFQLYP